MKLPFVSRKKYEIMKNNYALSMKSRKQLEDENVKTQIRINTLANEYMCAKEEITSQKKEIKNLKALLTRNGISYKKEKK